jgi:hypothetical protein
MQNEEEMAERRIKDKLRGKTKPNNTDHGELTKSSDDERVDRCWEHFRRWSWNDFNLLDLVSIQQCENWTRALNPPNYQNCQTE